MSSGSIFVCFRPSDTESIRAFSDCNVIMFSLDFNFSLSLMCSYSQGIVKPEWEQKWQAAFQEVSQNFDERAEGWKFHEELKVGNEEVYFCCFTLFLPVH